MKNFLLGISLLLALLLPSGSGRATLVTIPSPIYFPGNMGNVAGVPAFGNAAVIASGQYVAYVFTAREDMVVSHVGFRIAAASGSPAAEVRIETLDATGFCSGTLWATNTNGTTGTLTASTYTLQALTASASITKGQPYCVKIAYASGTSFTLLNLNGYPLWYAAVSPYQIVNTGTPTKSTMTSFSSTVALGSSSTSFYQVPGAFPANAYSSNTFNNSVAGAKRGMRFTIPYNARVVGIRFFAGAVSGDYNIILMDDAGNELNNSSTAVDGDTRAGSTNGAVLNFFDNTVTVTAGAAYRAVIEPTTTTNVNIGTVTLPSSTYQSASPAGTTAFYTTFTTAGGWVDSATDQIPSMDILIDQIDNGSGTGSTGGNSIIGVQ